jgi:hypothetical protein
MYKLLFLLPVFTISYISSIAQVEKIDTDRPDQTESAVIVPKKWIQVEAGFSKQQNSPGSTEFQHPTLLSKYGITKRIELRLITTLTTNTYYNAAQLKQKESGLEPVELGVKIALWEEKKLLPKTSLLFHVAIPKLATKKFHGDKLAPNFRFTMQHSITNNIAIGYNLGAEWDGFSNEATWIYTFAPGINLGEKWYGYIEAFGFISKQNKPEHSIDAGIAYYINSNFKLDLSSGFGISEEAPDWYIAIGASFRFKTGK